MAISFPTSPVLNDTYTVGTKTWVYNGYAWDLVTANLVPTLLLANAAFDKANSANVLAYSNSVSLSTNVNTLAATFVAANANSVSLSTNVNVLAASFAANSVSLSANVNTLAANVNTLAGYAVANDASQGANIAVLAASFVSNSQSLSTNVNTLASNVNTLAGNTASLSANVNTLAGSFVSNSQTLSANVNTLAAAFVSNSQSLSTNVNTLVANVNTLAGNTASLSTNVNVLVAAVVANDASQGANIAVLAASFVSNSQTLSANVNTLAANVNTLAGNTASLSTNVNTLAATFVAANANSVSLSTNVNVLAANVNTLAGAAYPKSGGTIVGDVAITGNLTISGNTSYVNTQTLLIGDNILILNADIPGNITATENAGIEVNRGNKSGNAQFLWVEAANAWGFTGNSNTAISTYIVSNTTLESANAGTNLRIDNLVSSTTTNSQTLSANVNTLAASFVSNSQSLSTNVNVLAASFVSNSQSLSANVNVLAACTAGKLANTSGVSFNGNLYFPTGNVGIGTTTANAQLDIGGAQTNVMRLSSSADSANYYTQIINYYNSAKSFEITQGGVSFLRAAQQGYGSVELGPNPYHWKTNYASGYISANTNSAERMRIDSSGNTGINTISPTAKLHVAGAAGITGFRVDGQGGANFYVDYLAQGSNYYDATSHYFRGNAGSGTSLYIAGGKVGVGGVTSPSANLHVQSGAAVSTPRGAGFTKAFFTSDAASYLELQSNTTYDILFSSSSGSGYGLVRYENLNQNLSFWTASSQRATIDSSGNMGIGVSVPSYKLDVTGTGRATTDFRAPIFYDSDDTGYYLNPANVSKANTFGIETGQFTNYFAALNVSDGQGAAQIYRDIDLHGSWVTNESHAITAVHSTANTNIVGQMLFTYDGTGSRISWGKQYHSADSTTLHMNLVSTSTTAAYLEVNGSMRSPVYYDKDNTSYWLDPASSNSAIIAGNVSIGTTLTDYKMTVFGAGSADDDHLIALGFTSFTPYATIGTHNVDGTSGGIKFSTKGSGTLSERMRIDSSGNMGIGITSPLAILHANTADNAWGGFISSPSGAVRIGGYITGYSSPTIQGVTSSGAAYQKLFIDAANISFGISGTTKALIDSSGIVRIGSTSGVGAGEILSANGFAMIGKTGANPQVLIGDTAAGTGVIGTYNNYMLDVRVNNTTRMNIDANGNVAIGQTTTATPYKLFVNGSFAANTKSFVIDHPTKPGMKLRYGSLEGPENGVYVRGKLDGTRVIDLPDYWEGLVDLDSITVQLTAIGRSQNLYVTDIDGLKIHIDTENHTQPYCFYHVYAERKDVEKLVVEF
jgi:hypothetical protein